MGDRGGGRDESGDWPGLGADNGGLKTARAAAAWRPYDLSTSSVYVKRKRPVNAERLFITSTMSILYCLSRGPVSAAYDKYGEKTHFKSLSTTHLHRICRLQFKTVQLYSSP